MVERTVKENEDNFFFTFLKLTLLTLLAQASKTLKNNAYTDDDVDLGTKTTGLSTNADDFKTNEFNKDSSKI